MERKKYLVRVIRPVFEAAVVEVEAEDEHEAVGRAVSDAFAIPEESWKGTFDPENYFYDSHCLHVRESEDGNAFTSLANYPKYALLQVDLNLGAGKVVYQPWLNEVEPLLAADVCSDWSEELKRMRNIWIEEAFEPVDLMLELLESRKTKVLPFARPSELKRSLLMLKSLRESMKEPPR